MKKYFLIMLFLFIFATTISVTTANEIDSTESIENDLMLSSSIHDTFINIESKVTEDKIVEHKTWDDLKSCIENATSNTIYLNGSTFNATKDCNPINITKDITINGKYSNGTNAIATIDGKGLTQIITTTANITIINVKFVNGTHTLASVIESKGNTLTLINCSFDNNKGNSKVTSSSDSVVYIENGKLTIINTTFNNNIAQNQGGAIYIKNGNLTIINSTFNHNTVKKYNGGAVYLENGNIEIINSKLNNNIAKNHGGAVYLKNGNLIIINTTLENNTANYNNIGGGGAIYLNSGKLTIINSELNSNVANYEGGAIYIKNGEIVVTNSIFEDNTAKKYEGGAVYLDSGKISMINSTFENNTAINDDGGAIYLRTGKLTIINSELNSNVANYEGGAIYIKNGEIVVTNSILNNNTVNDNGGAIYLDSGKITINGTELNSNVANEGGAIYFRSGNLMIISSKLNNNVAERYNGGAIYLKKGNLTLLKCNFKDNIASEGASVMSIDSEVNIYNCTFINNTTNIGSQLMVKNVNLALYNNTFINASVPIYISDNTKISSPTFVLGNVTGKYETTIPINIRLTDDNNNTIKSSNQLAVKFNDEETINLVYNNEIGIYDGVYHAINRNISNVSCIEFLNLTSKLNVYIWNETKIILNHTIAIHGVNINVTLNTDGIITFLLNDKIIDTISTINKVATIQINNMTPGDYTIKAIFNGNDVYYPANITDYFTINTYNSELELSHSVNGDHAIIHATSNVDGDIHFYLNDEEIGSVSTSNKVASIQINNLTPGSHTIKAIFESCMHYIPSNASNQLVLNKYDSSLGLSHVVDGSSVVVSATLSTDGDVDFYLNGEKIGTVSTKDNVASICINGLTPGNHTIKAIYDGDNHYLACNISNQLVLNKYDSSLGLSHVVDGSSVVVSATLSTDGDVDFYVDGIFNSTIKTENNIATLELYNLKEGTHNITAIFNGSAEYENAEASTSFNIDKQIIIVANPVVMYKGNGSRLNVSVKDIEGNPLSNFNITITVNNVSYNKTTDKDGFTTLTLMV